MTVLARCVGNYFEWACRLCQHLVQSRDVPPEGEEHCSGCSTILGLAASSLGIAELMGERDRLISRISDLEKQVGELEDEVYELRSRVSA